MEKVEQTRADCNPERLDDTLNDLKSYIERAAKQGLAAHEVEADIWRRVLLLGHQALDLLFHLVGSGDVGESTALPDGHEVRRLEGLHSRTYQSVFGRFEVSAPSMGVAKGKRLSMSPSTPSYSCPRVSFPICSRTGLQAWRLSRLIVACPRRWGAFWR